MKGTVKKDFFEWTLKALDETDNDRFIELLLKREESAGKLTAENCSLSEDEAAIALEMERAVLNRLYEEKARIIHEVDELSVCIKASRAYRARFPIPPMPVFLSENK